MPRVNAELRYTIGAKDVADVSALREQLAAWPIITERSTVVPLPALSAVHCDAMWYPCNFVTVRPASGAIVPTVHDLFPMLQLDGRWWKVMKRTRARRRYQATINAASHIITGARASRDEIVATFGVPFDHISVVPHAADGLAAADPAQVDALLDRIAVRGPFLLVVGSQESRKNLGVLYAAVQHLHDRGVALPVVQCGPAGAHGYKPGDRMPAWLRHAGYVSDAELVALYARALALVFPSRYEGFGLPVLEAMTAGGVVICANASTMPEVGGDAVLYFPPDDSAALERQIMRVHDEPALRETLITRGRERAAHYSWQQSAAGTLAAIARAMRR